MEKIDERKLILRYKTASPVNDKVRSCNLKINRTATDFAKVHGNRASAWKLNVDVKRINEWQKLKEATAEKETLRTGRNHKRLAEREYNPKGAGISDNCEN